MERLACLLIGYLCGLFQTSYLIGKFHHTDIREHGSGNAGTTNALRTFGKKAGALTLLGDCLKCIVAIWIVRAVFRERYGDFLPLLSLYAAFGCVLGHNFPCYLNFRGGKGIAASVGMLIAFDWKLVLIGAVVFFGIYFATHYISLCSLTTYVTALIFLIIFGQMGYYGMNQAHRNELYVVMLLMTILAFVRHRANIKRLLSGTESKIYLKQKGQV